MRREPLRVRAGCASVIRIVQSRSNPVHGSTCDTTCCLGFHIEELRSSCLHATRYGTPYRHGSHTEAASSTANMGHRPVDLVVANLVLREASPAIDVAHRSVAFCHHFRQICPTPKPHRPSHSAMPDARARSGASGRLDSRRQTRPRSHTHTRLFVPYPADAGPGRT